MDIDEEHKVIVQGRLPRVARIQSEFIKYIADPIKFFQNLKDSTTLKADLFTFVNSPYRDLCLDSDLRISKSVEKKAILNITTYENWWTKQINDKTRNMVRKSGKKGAIIRVTDFNDELVKGIHGIYNETPIRQGRPYGHYGKTVSEVSEANKTFSDISDYIGVWFKDELIGFAKLLKLKDYSVLMQIVAKIAHRDKSPTNALLAKAVELCAEKGQSRMMYGIWSRGTLGDFKIKNGFECIDFSRNFLPFNKRGMLSLKFGMHESFLQKWIDRLPESQYRTLANYRTRMHYFLNRKKL